MKEMEKPKFVAIVGPTASGKSSLALELAKYFGGEIINADSMQVYRGLDIGTAKPSVENRRLVVHHLVDILHPDQEYSAGLFRQHADAVIHELHRRKTPIFVVGGTGLYLKVLTRGLFRGPAGNSELRLALYKRAEMNGSESLHQELQKVDPEAASRIHPNDKFRIIRALEVYHFTQKPISYFQKGHGFLEAPYEVLKVGLQCERDELYRRIEIRLEKMMEMGWVEEVRSLLNRGYAPNLKSLQSLGYKYIISYLSGDIKINEAVRLIKRDTRRYAKRQITWFKADPEINWFPANWQSFQGIAEGIERFLK
ncbi:MAG: tRNA (adenosine(37)-N6)-dimethylallyltransferase MiaA [Deltaproteobacteria bacterium]|nr:tRNA (adenosine(37)-N6)-dimethylallyltransferase MiaA [Deltaproteobacteria bacterium]